MFSHRAVWNLARTIKGSDYRLRMHKSCINTEQEQDAHSEAV